MSASFESTSLAVSSATNREILSPLVMKGFNLVAAQIMSKPARINFPEETRHECPACEFSQPGWPCHHR